MIAALVLLVPLSGCTVPEGRSTDPVVVRGLADLKELGAVEGDGSVERPFTIRGVEIRVASRGIALLIDDPVHAYRFVGLVVENTVGPGVVSRAAGLSLVDSRLLGASEGLGLLVNGSAELRGVSVVGFGTSVEVVGGRIVIRDTVLRDPSYRGLSLRDGARVDAGNLTVRQLSLFGMVSGLRDGDRFTNSTFSGRSGETPCIVSEGARARFEGNVFAQCLGVYLESAATSNVLVRNAFLVEGSSRDEGTLNAWSEEQGNFWEGFRGTDQAGGVWSSERSVPPKGADLRPLVTSPR